MPSRRSRPIPGLARRPGQAEPRLSDLILGVTAVLFILVVCLSVLAAAA